LQRRHDLSKSHASNEYINTQNRVLVLGMDVGTGLGFRHGEMVHDARRFTKVVVTYIVTQYLSIIIKVDTECPHHN